MHLPIKQVCAPLKTVLGGSHLHPEIKYLPGKESVYQNMLTCNISIILTCIHIFSKGHTAHYFYSVVQASILPPYKLTTFPDKFYPCYQRCKMHKEAFTYSI